MKTKSNKPKLDTTYTDKLLRFQLYYQEMFFCKDLLPEKDMLEKAAALKRFEYSLLGKELEKQTSVAEKNYERFESKGRKIPKKI